jgi:hypothetical protein
VGYSFYLSSFHLFIKQQKLFSQWIVAFSHVQYTPFFCQKKLLYVPFEMPLNCKLTFYIFRSNSKAVVAVQARPVKPLTGPDRLFCPFWCIFGL